MRRLVCALVFVVASVPNVAIRHAAMQLGMRPTISASPNLVGGAVGPRPAMQRTASPLMLASPLSTDLFIQVAEVIEEDEGSRPVADLLANPAATAYLVVLAVLFSFLGFLLYRDIAAKKRREDGFAELNFIAQELREKGKVEEAEVVEREAQRERREAKAAARAEAEQAKATPALDDVGNRFQRRQQGFADDDEAPKKKGPQIGRKGRGIAEARKRRKSK